MEKDELLKRVLMMQRLQGMETDQTNLLKSIDRLTNQVADLTTQNKTLQQKVNDLLSQISVGNKVRFGSTSQKGTKKTAPVQDREKDKDDFDGTNGAAMSSNSQADAAHVALSRAFTNLHTSRYPILYSTITR